MGALQGLPVRGGNVVQASGVVCGRGTTARKEHTDDNVYSPCIQGRRYESPLLQALFKNRGQVKQLPSGYHDA